MARPDIKHRAWTAGSSRGFEVCIKYSNFSKRLLSAWRVRPASGHVKFSHVRVDAPTVLANANTPMTRANLKVMTTDDNGEGRGCEDDEGWRARVPWRASGSKQRPFRPISQHAQIPAYNADSGQSSSRLKARHEFSQCINTSCACYLLGF